MTTIAVAVSNEVIRLYLHMEICMNPFDPAHKNCLSRHQVTPESVLMQVQIMRDLPVVDL